MMKPVVILDPFPRRISDIFTNERFNSLSQIADLKIHDDGRSSMPYDQLDKYIQDAVVIIGQPDLPGERLSKAKKLKGIINVETNFFPNVDYDYCADHGIHVVTPGSAFAPVVAEASLGMAIDLARGITRSDRDFRNCQEKYGLESNQQSFSLFNAPIGIIGYGDLGRKLHSLIKPFGGVLRVFDPWLPDYFLQKQDAIPATLNEVLQNSKVIFVFASVSSENEGFINAEKLSMIPDNSVFLLMSRAAVVNWDDLIDQAASGRLKVGTDVFPEEPLSQNDPIRKIPNVILSAHRAGALVEALYDIGDQTVADAGLMLRGLPPIVCRKAMKETVKLSRSKPVSKT